MLSSSNAVAPSRARSCGALVRSAGLGCRPPPWRDRSGGKCSGEARGPGCGRWPGALCTPQCPETAGGPAGGPGLPTRMREARGTRAAWPRCPCQESAQTQALGAGGTQPVSPRAAPQVPHCRAPQDRATLGRAPTALRARKMSPPRPRGPGAAGA